MLTICFALIPLVTALLGFALGANYGKHDNFCLICWLGFKK